VEDLTCDLTWFRGLSSPTMSFRTTPRNIGSCPNCRDNIQWFSSSAAEGSAKDRRQAEGLVELHRELEVAYCRLVTVSTDNITETNEYRSGVGAHWPFLSDVRRMIQKDLDIAEYTDPAHNPMIPHVIVLEPGLVIYKIYNGYWFFGRPTVEDLRQDLRAVTRKCRPDWDITTPELRAAWQQGRSSIRTAKRTSKHSMSRIGSRKTMRISSRGYVALVVLAVVVLLAIAQFGPAVLSAISPGLST
jgi:peroxiredoxin